MNEQRNRFRAGLAGAAAAGLAFGITEFAAGLFSRVPSAISAVGSHVVDWSPGFVERTAIEIFGTADKGALAIGTVVVGVLVGYAIGRASWSRRWLPAAAFAVFGVVGIVTSVREPLISAPATVIVVIAAAVAGWAVLSSALKMLRESMASVGTSLDVVPVDPSRRRFALTVLGAGALALVGGWVGRGLTISRSERVRESTGLPVPRTVASVVRDDNFFAVEGLEEIVVPTKDFYRIDTALVVPRPNPETWTLTIRGLVDREVSFTLDDILGMDLHERYVTISCVSNEVGGDLVGNALWTGVELTELLDRAGVGPEGTQLVGRSVDGWTAGFPTDIAFDGREPLLAVGMNGSPLPPAHGYPARLIVPGLYGYVSATKWIEEIEITTWDGFDGYWIPRGWAKEGPIKTQSRIDTPGRGNVVAGAPTVIAGVAWAPLRGIERVEVRVDDEDWRLAELTTPLSDASWVQWKLEVPLAPGDHRAVVRATDGDGATQTEERSRPAPDGATGWHGVDFETI